LGADEDDKFVSIFASTSHSAAEGELEIIIPLRRISHPERNPSDLDASGERNGDIEAGYDNEDFEEKHSSSVAICIALLAVVSLVGNLNIPFISGSKKLTCAC